MKKLILLAALLVGCGNMSPSGDITSITPATGGGLTGGAQAGAAQLGLLTTCAAAELLKWSGTAWACQPDANSGGTITQVIAGTGASGGGSSGSVTIDVNCLIGLDCNTNNINISDRDWGDITSSNGGLGSGTTWTIDANTVTYAKMQDVSATSRFIGRVTAGAGDPEELTGTQATSLLNAFTTSLKGLVPAPGTSTGKFLKDDGTWATAGGGALSGLTTNFVPVATSSTTIADGHLKDDGTNVYVMSSAGGGTAKVTIAEATGNTSIGGTLDTTGRGTFAGDYLIHSGGVYSTSDMTLGFAFGSNSTQTGYINYYGFNGGTSQFRNLIVADGKGAAIATFTGSTKAVVFTGSLQGDTLIGATSAQTPLLTTSRVQTKTSCTAPTLTCGSSPNIVGCDMAGTVIVGTGSPGSCTITFANSYVGTGGYPTCVVTAQNGTAKSYSVSTTAITINSPVSSTKYDYVCVDH